MEGHGWCVDAKGHESTARRFLSDASYFSASSICSSDDKCAGFVYEEDTRKAIVYTTTGCTKDCSVATWTQNPTLIKAAVSKWRSVTSFENGLCHRKRRGKSKRQYFHVKICLDFNRTL